MPHSPPRPKHHRPLHQIPLVAKIHQTELITRKSYYWLLHELRGAAPKRSIWRTATFETIRCTFLKIAVRIQELKTRIKMALPSAYPHVQALTALATSIAALAP